MASDGVKAEAGEGGRGERDARVRKLRRVTLALYLALISVFLFGPHVCPIHGIVFKHPWQIVTPISFSPGTFSWRDLLSNVGAFFVLAVLMVRAGVPSFDERWLRVAAITGFALVLSASAEWFQQYLPGRLPAIQDVIANVAGAVLGAIVAEWFRVRAEGARGLDVTSITGTDPPSRQRTSHHPAGTS